MVKLLLKEIRHMERSRGLRGLNLFLSDAEAVELLRVALAEGACQGLEELIIRSQCVVSNMGDVFALLAQGACPCLRELGLRTVELRGEAGKLLATAMESGYLGQHLEELYIRECDLGHNGWSLMAQTMEVTGAFKNLRRLQIIYGKVTRQDAEALGRAISNRHAMP